MSKIKSILFGTAFAAALFTSCSNEPALTASGLDPAAFDTIINEKPVKLYTLKNANGMEVCITNFGGRIVSIMVPDKNNNLQDVVLGYDNIRQYADSAMPTVSRTVSSPLTARKSSCRRTTTATVCTAVPPVGSIRCMMPHRQTKAPCS